MMKALIFFFCLSIISLNALSIPSDFVSGLVEILRLQANLHTYRPKTLWGVVAPEESNATGQVEKELLSKVLEKVEESPLLLPVVLGSFGKSIRTKHIHLSSFIILLEVPSSSNKGVLEWVSSNGNRKRDRYLFVGGDEEGLRSLRRAPLINDLRSKVCLVYSNKEAITLLLDPSVYSKVGLVDKVVVQRSSLPKIFKPHPLMGWNLRGRHLKVSGCLLPTWVYRTANEDGPSGVQHDGSNWRVFVEAGKRFNFTFELYAPPDQSYGAVAPNGSWSGMASFLYYTERGYDATMLLGHVLGWFHFVEFASTLDFANLVFMMGHPEDEVDAESFIRPYQKSVWGGVILAFGLISGAMFLILSLRKGLAFSQVLHKSLSIPYGIALEQDPRIPVPLRFLAILWMVTVIVTGTGYRSNLASFLSVPSVTPVPSEFADLAYSFDYQVALNKLGVAESQFFEVSDTPAIKTINRRLRIIPDTTKCLEKAFLSQKFACIVWTPIVFAVGSMALPVNARMEPLIASKGTALEASMSIGFLKDSPIVEAFTPITAGLFETGTYTRWAKDGLAFFKEVGKGRMSNPKGRDPLVYNKLKEFEDTVASLGSIKPFKVKNLKLPFVILVLGLGIGGIGFLIEVQLRKWKQMKKRILGVTINVQPAKENIALTNLGHVNK